MENKPILKNYQIPFRERTTRVGNEFPRTNTLFNVFGIGVIVNHQKGNVPTEQEVSRHLIGIDGNNSLYIQSESIHDALKEFFDYPACNIGFKHKAMEINDSESHPVIEYSGCKWLLNDGTRKCQRYAEPNEIDNMYCVLDGLDEPPCDCPINNQKQLNGWREQKEKRGGIYVKRYYQTVAPMSPIKGGIRPKKC